MAILWVIKGKVPYYYSRVIGYLTLLLLVLPIQMARPNEVEYRHTFFLKLDLVTHFISNNKVILCYIVCHSVCVVG